MSGLQETKFQRLNVCEGNTLQYMQTRQLDKGVVPLRSSIVMSISVFYHVYVVRSG